MKCECGKEITEIQNSINEDCAQRTKTEKLNLCESCWISYCDHAITGE